MLFNKNLLGTSKHFQWLCSIALPVLLYIVLHVIKLPEQTTNSTVVIMLGLKLINLKIDYDFRFQSSKSLVLKTYVLSLNEVSETNSIPIIDFKIMYKYSEMHILMI